MKNITTFILSSFMLIPSAFAYTGFGVCNYGNETISSVICNGPTVLKGTRINGDIKVTGSLQSADITVKSILVTGSTQIANAEVSGSVRVIGSFSADNVNFKQGIAIDSNDIILNHSKVKGLVTIASPNSTPYLQVQCSSTITGSVVFVGKAGIVQITGESAVLGKVVNGAMEFVKRTCSQ